MDQTKTEYLPEGNWVERRFSLQEQVNSLRATERRQRGQINRLRWAMNKAREKLGIYHANVGGVYMGGMEYTALIALIDESLSEKRDEETNG